jgi:hypothetical protein
MTPTEAVALTRYVKACCPQQQIDNLTPDAWYDLLDDLSLADCHAAVKVLGRRQPFISPAEIRAEVRRVRRDRLEREIVAAPPAELADNPAAYREVLKGNVKRIADGFAITRAIGELPSAAPPPVAEIRKALGPAIPPAERHLPPEEIARRQVAEARAARGANVIPGTVISDEGEPAA